MLKEGDRMSIINLIESKLRELEGGKFQKLGNTYLSRKYGFEKMVALGSQAGTDKTTRGVPDTYYECRGKYVYVMYGTYQSAFKKLIEDIEGAKKQIIEDKLPDTKIDRIICCHTSSNITVGQQEELRQLALPHQLELIGINELANDLTTLEFQIIAKDYLGISPFTEQIWTIKDFIKVHDSSRTNAPVNNLYLGDITSAINHLQENQILVISSKPGTGKTRLALEICCHFYDQSYNVICVKNNGQSIYEEVKAHLISGKNNLVFIDDVNLTQNYRATLHLLKVREDIKFILTVRDYARSSVVRCIEEFCYSIIEPEIIATDNLRALAYNFSNQDIDHRRLDHIIELSKGNPRLLILAAMLSQSADSFNFKSEVDILKNYYGAILEENKIVFHEQKVLFILAYLKKVNLTTLETSEEIVALFRMFGLTIDDFRQSLERLHNKELCDIFEDKIVKIADQSLDDYIVVKFLQEEKVRVESVLEELYLFNPSRVVDLLNQFANFCHSEAEIRKLAQAAKSYYAKSSFDSSEQKEEFLTKFGGLMPFEALTYLKEILPAYPCADYEKNDFLSKKDKTASIPQSIFSIIVAVSQTKQAKLALQLLLKYFDKNPNEIAKVYSILREYFGLCTHRDIIDYSFANGVLEEIELLDFSRDYNQDLICPILKEYLKLEVERTRFNDMKATFMKISIPQSDYLIDYRQRAFQLLSRLYREGRVEMRNFIEKLLLDYREIIKYSDSHHQMIVADLQSIETLFFQDISNLSLIEERIVYKLSTLATKHHMPVFQDYTVSERQEVYEALTNQDLAWPYREEHTSQLKAFCQRYAHTWSRIFHYAKVFQSYPNMMDDKIERILVNVFQELTLSEKITYLQAMFEAMYKFETAIPDVILQDISRNDLEVLIGGLSGEVKYKWQFALLVNLDEPTLEDISQLKELLKLASIPPYYSILSFEKFILKDSSLKDRLIEKANRDQFLLPEFIHDDKVENLLTLVDQSHLKELYISNIPGNVDRSLSLFRRLSLDDSSFVVRILQKISDYRLSNSNQAYMLQHVIEELEHKELIYQNYLMSTIKSDSLYYHNSLLESILTDNPNVLLHALELATDEELGIKLINTGVDMLEDSETKLALFELMKEKRWGMTTYKKIHFTPRQSSWFGSYVPILEQQQKFLSRVKQMVESELDYLDLIQHIELIERSLLERIGEELEREFLSS